LLFEDLYYCIELLWWHLQFTFLPGKLKEEKIWIPNVGK